MSITSVVNDTVTSESVINALKPLPPTISGYSVGGLDDTALDPAGGQTVQINGTGFLAGATITFDGSAVAVVTYVNPNRLTFTSPAKSAGTYTIYVVNPDGGTAIFIPGIIYSVLPTWTTSAGTLGSYYETTSISNTVVASGDAPITYSLFSGSLPTGSTLYANGVITGTAPVDSSSTTYSFTIEAIDAQLQGSTRSFSLTINVDAVTWVSPANNTTYTSAVDSAIANVALSATDAAGYAVSYSANALPTGLSLTGSNIAGTPTVIADSSTLLTATAATTNRTATRTINWSITVANDVYFEYNTLLIPGASTTFVDDASTNNFAVTINGDTKPNNTNPYTPGYYSNLFDGTVDRLVPSANAAFAFGTGAFCIEAWMYNTTLKNYSCLVTTRPDNSNYADAYHIGFDSVGGLSLYVNDTSRAGCPAGTVILNIWQHLVCCRNASGLVSIYINGVRKGTETVTTNFTRNLLGIADFPTTPAEGLIGYISNLRLVKGSSVYDPTQTSITVPTTPLTAIANTSILTCQSNRFIDNSTNNFTLTVFGDTKIQSFQPFTPNTSYSTYGSGYFDGTGDYLTSPANTAFAFAKGDLTVQMWIYPTATITTPANIGLFYIEEVNGLVVGLSNGYIAMGRRTIAYDLTSTYIPIVNTWTHIAVTRSGATAWIFANGVQVGTVTAAGGDPNNNSNYVCTTGLPTIAGNYAGGAGFGYFPGYISDIQVVKGTAVYTTTFTPPATPLTAIANTSLLTLQNNQSVNNSVFLDNSTNNFFVTRNGNTTQGTFSPYGGNWSNYFDGTGDYLTTPASSILDVGNTSWTIECWVYMNNTTGTQMIVGYNNTSATDFWDLTVVSGVPTFKRRIAASEVAVSGGTISANVFTNVTVVRNGTAVTIYLNGSSVATNANVSMPTSMTDQILGIGANRYGLGYDYYFNGFISNLRMVKGTAVYTSNFTPSTTPLTPITNTVLLTCADNRLIDNSINNFTITKNGDVSVQRFSPFNPSIVTPTSYSGYFDGTGDYLTTPSSASISNFSGDFTIEGWVYLISTTQFGVLVGGNGSAGWYIEYGYQRGFGAYDGSSFLNGNSSAVTNQWVNFAVSRSGSTVRFFINGALTASQTSANFNYTQALGIGAYSSGSSFITGYLSNIRINNTTALYTSAFTPSTTPLTAIANTSLLTLQSPTFIDNSTNNFTLTAFGNSQPTQQNPFGFTSATTNGYTVSTIGGSGYFDGSDYLSVPNNAALNLGNNSWTCELWIYPTGNYTTYNTLFAKRNSATLCAYEGYLTPTDGYLGYYNGTLYSSSTAPKTNAWNHVAYVFDGTNIKIYLNGTQVLSSATSNADQAVDLYIGIYNSAGTPFDYYFGYISDFRLVKGTTLYTSNFVPPSAPLTAVQNTTFLSNMTSAGVYDAAMMNTMETVGDAKLSTAVSKFGGSSMYFDGTGDYLYSAPNINQVMSSGDFTIELWYYPITHTNDFPAVIGNYNATWTANKWILHAPNQTYQTSNKYGFWVNNYSAVASMLTSTSNVTDGAWVHIAITRSGSTWRMFINGTVESTVTSSVALDGGTVASIEGLYIGANFLSGGNGRYINAYIDDLRITKGYARYTTNFSVPTSAFPIY